MPEKGKNGKKRKHKCFRFYIPCAFFSILNLKIHIKKGKNAKKNFQIAKIHIQKKAENNISKKHAKKSRNAKKKQVRCISSVTI